MRRAVKTRSDEPEVDDPVLPLTHHQILELVAPCARSGWRVDLAASDRVARRVVFKPRDLPDTVPPLRATLALEAPEQGELRLTRGLLRPDGLQAPAVAEGRDVADLLTRIEAVAPGQHFSAGPGWLAALGWRMRRSAAPQLHHAELRVAGLTLQMTVSSVPRIPAELTLRAATGGAITELPHDLLSVLGGDWSRLTHATDHWKASVDLRGRDVTQRSADALRRLQAAATHLVRTLAEPPRRFHERHRAARWRATVRRAVPLAACVGVIGAALAVPALDLPEDSVVRMLIFNAPPILLGLFVVLREMPRVELPPLPRPLAETAWRPHGPADQPET